MPKVKAINKIVDLCIHAVIAAFISARQLAFSPHTTHWPHRMDAELQEYQTQLGQVEAAIEADPGNEELKNLREGLNNLIDLTKSIAGQAHASTSAPSSFSAPSSSSAEPIRESSTAATKPSRPTFAAGDDCLAKYAVSTCSHATSVYADLSACDGFVLYLM